MDTRQPQVALEPKDVLGHAFRYDWFAFYQGWLKGRKLKAHHLRDGAAFRELSMALDDRGGRYAKLVRNGPATPEKTKHYEQLIHDRVERNERPLVEEVVAYQQVDESFLGEGRALVVSTRLPMNDFQQGDKIQVQPGFTSIEQKAIRACRPYLPVCARSRVRLANAVANELPGDYADRADILFRAYEEPWYSELCAVGTDARRRRARRGERRTAAYLLQLPAVPGLHGADLIVMWGQGGTQTLAFAQRLHRDLSFLLDHYGLSMVEFVAGPSAAPTGPPEMAPFLLLDSAPDWSAEVLLQGVLLDADGKVVGGRVPVRRGKTTS
jgi:hypothetical protein